MTARICDKATKGNVWVIAGGGSRAAKGRKIGFHPARSVRDEGAFRARKILYEVGWTDAQQERNSPTSNRRCESLAVVDANTAATKIINRPIPVFSPPMLCRKPRAMPLLAKPEGVR